LLFIALSKLWRDTPVLFASDLPDGASDASFAAYDEAILGAGDINLDEFAATDEIDPQSASRELLPLDNGDERGLSTAALTVTHLATNPAARAPAPASNHSSVFRIPLVFESG
jgi:hypothetical protein